MNADYWTKTTKLTESQFQALIHAAYWAGRADCSIDPQCENYPKTFDETVQRVAAHKASEEICNELDITAAWERKYRAEKAAVAA